MSDKDNRFTIIIFSNDLDKVLAGFILAVGAASSGMDVSMFFTFWGLTVLRKKNKVKIKKPLIDAMFGAMTPRGVEKLKLSKMNMLGAGTSMMKQVMKKKNISSLPELFLLARELGVSLCACSMSMDVLGISGDELIDGLEHGGVATYLEKAQKSGINLFI